MLRTEFGVFNLGTKQGLDKWHQSVRRNNFRPLGTSSSRAADKNSTAFESAIHTHAENGKGKYCADDNSQVWDSELRLRGSAVKLGKTTVEDNNLKHSTRNIDHHKNIDHGVLIEKNIGKQKSKPECRNNLQISNNLSIIDTDDGSPSSCSEMSSLDATLSQKENFKEVPPKAELDPIGAETASTDPTSQQSSSGIEYSGQKVPENQRIQQAATFHSEEPDSAASPVSTVVLTLDLLRSRLVDARQKQYRRIFLPGKGWISIQRLEKEIEVAESRTGMEDSGT